MTHAAILTLAMHLAVTSFPVPAGPPPETGKVKIQKPSDLPKHVYFIQSKPSELLMDRDGVLALARQVDKETLADLEKFDIQDKASLMSLHSTLYVTGMLKKDHGSARRYLDSFRKLLDNPTQKLTTGLVAEPLMQAMDAPGPNLHATFRTLLSKRLGELPFKEVEASLQALLARQKNTSRDQLVSGIAAGLDPIVKDGQLNEDATGTLLATAMNLHILLPFKEDAVACLEQLMAAHPSEKKDGKPSRKPIKTTQIQAKGAYFGQPLPGETPVLFAPEILNRLSPWVSGIAFSPDGSECFLHVGDADYNGASMYASTCHERGGPPAPLGRSASPSCSPRGDQAKPDHHVCVKGEWTSLVEPAFLSDFSMAFEPVFSKDGQTLTFTGAKGEGKADFWTVKRTNQGWGSPVAMPSPINSEANEFRGSFTADGSFYFGSERSSPGINQVYKASRNASQAWVVERLGPPINALSFDGDPCVAPDGRFLVIYAGLTGGMGRVDLYVSFSDGKGGWGQLINLGPQFNSPDDEFGASLTADGKYMFFTRHTAQGDKLFWVAVSAIDKLKP